jgi:hypothetical protein
VDAPRTPRRYSIRRDITVRFYVSSEDGPYVRVELSCGHDRVYACARQPKIGAKVACQVCAPREVR